MTYTLADYVRDHGRPPRSGQHLRSRALAPAADAVLAAAYMGR